MRIGVSRWASLSVGTAFRSGMQSSCMTFRRFPEYPFPCYDGIRRTMEVYDSHEMRKYEPEDFYDDRILRELDQSGFVEQTYDDVRASR